MSLQAEVVSKSMYGGGQTSDHSSGMAAHHAAAHAAAAAAVARESLCLSNTSLHALQNLQPWGGENIHPGLVHHHPDRPPFSLASSMC